MTRIEKRRVAALPRLPLEGSFDLTYRCNNDCRHCWVRRSPDAPEEDRELSFDEIRRIAEEAGAMGCRVWNISGGEPMLRQDFVEIFRYLSARSRRYSLNTNATLITPDIARLMTRKGNKMVALYGATPDVHDHVTRRPGSFETAMRGIRLLKDAGAGFTLQLVPMRDNRHQLEAMIALARDLERPWRIGAPWLYLSRCGDPARNREIEGQRLPPADVVALDPPGLGYEERLAELQPADRRPDNGDDRLFARCITARRDFHVDPYGGLSWCSVIADPALRFDLRRGSFEEGWNRFIPSCAEAVRGGEEYDSGCGACDKRADCRWCAAYAFLESGRYAAPIPYLCEAAEATRRHKEEWRTRHRRYFRVADITVRIESDLDFDRVRIKDQLRPFAVDGPGEDNVTFAHYFGMPDLTGRDLGREIYRKAPWAVSRRGESWVYRGLSPAGGDSAPHKLAVFNAAHTRAKIYSPEWRRAQVLADGWGSLALFPTDQIWLARLLADREAVLLHAAAAVLNGRGLVFAGHSEAGKSTTMELLKSARRTQGLRVEILCDDRNVIRRRADGWRVFGTWSSGTTPDVSASSGPLAAILFLAQAGTNRLDPLTDRRRILAGLLETLVRPVETPEWWAKELAVLERLVADVPCYRMSFDKSGDIVTELLRLAPEADRAPGEKNG